MTFLLLIATAVMVPPVLLTLLGAGVRWRIAVPLSVLYGLVLVGAILLGVIWPLGMWLLLAVLLAGLAWLSFRRARRRA